MGDVSASRKYPCSKINPAKLLKIVQKQIAAYGGRLSEIKITGDITYEDGISENREFTIEEINNLHENYDFKLLHFKTKQFRVCISSWDTNFYVMAFADSRKTVLQFFDCVEKDIVAMDEINHEIELENCSVTDDLIQKLACDGKKLVENAAEENLQNNIDQKESEEDLEIKKKFAEMGFPNLEIKELENKLEPQLDPQFVDCGMIDEYTPEKTELWDGILYFGEPWISRMFLLHLYHIGLNEAVKFAPKEMWLKALDNLNKGNEE